MNREYHKWFSANLQKEMELLVFGHRGASVLFFPTRCAHFYDYENWKVIEAIQPKIEAGYVQLFCIDSVDKESFYCHDCQPAEKILRYIQYEKYILEEVLPFINYKNPNSYTISAGCSMGAYHAVNIAFKHPDCFDKVIGMSGRYDLTRRIGIFSDLFNGYRNEDIYFNMPSFYIPNLTDPNILKLLSKMEIILAVGQFDAFLINNKDLSDTLTKKGLKNEFYIWEHEAHNPLHWGKMLQLYL